MVKVVNVTFHVFYHNKEKKKLGLSWLLSGKESACQCRGHRFDPSSGKMPHASGATRPECHNY